MLAGNYDLFQGRFIYGVVHEVFPDDTATVYTYSKIRTYTPGLLYLANQIVSLDGKFYRVLQSHLINDISVPYDLLQEIPCSTVNLGDNSNPYKFYIHVLSNCKISLTRDNNDTFNVNTVVGSHRYLAVGTPVIVLLLKNEYYIVSFPTQTDYVNVTNGYIPQMEFGKYVYGVYGGQNKIVQIDNGIVTDITPTTVDFYSKDYYGSKYFFNMITDISALYGTDNVYFVNINGHISYPNRGDFYISTAALTSVGLTCKVKRYTKEQGIQYFGISNTYMNDSQLRFYTSTAVGFVKDQTTNNEIAVIATLCNDGTFTLSYVDVDYNKPFGGFYNTLTDSPNNIKNIGTILSNVPDIIPVANRFLSAKVQNVTTDDKEKLTLSFLFGAYTVDLYFKDGSPLTANAINHTSFDGTTYTWNGDSYLWSNVDCSFELVVPRDQESWDRQKFQMSYTAFGKSFTEENGYDANYPINYGNYLKSRFGKAISCNDNPDCVALYPEYAGHPEDREGHTCFPFFMLKSVYKATFVNGSTMVTLDRDIDSRIANSGSLYHGVVNSPSNTILSQSSVLNYTSVSGNTVTLETASTQDLVNSDITFFTLMFLDTTVETRAYLIHDGTYLPFDSGFFMPYTFYMNNNTEVFAILLESQSEYLKAYYFDGANIIDKTTDFLTLFPTPSSLRWLNYEDHHCLSNYFRTNS